MKNKWTCLCLCTLITILGGCASYDYIAPTTASGRQCVATCESTKQTCQIGAKQVAASKETACQLRESNRLAICLATAKDLAAKNKCNESRTYCSQVASDYTCTEGYDRCFTNCGGKIVETQ